MSLRHLLVRLQKFPGSVCCPMCPDCILPPFAPFPAAVALALLRLWYILTSTEDLLGQTLNKI